MSLKRVGIPSPNMSSRGGSKPRLLVLHTSEGATSYQSLGNYFANPSSEVSSHVGIDDTPNTVGEYVGRSNKAWTSCNANPVAVQAELCTPSGGYQWTTAQWNTHSQMLANTAAWLAEESAANGIPLVKLSPSQAQGGSAGVCQHADLGSWGCGHVDCGAGFPIDQVISMATGKPGPAPGPTPPTPTPTPPPSGAAPPFPYPSNHYLGQPSSDPCCHSGYYGGVDNTNVATWQRQMAARGWSIGGIDGCYGPTCTNVCRQFQQEKGLSVDGLVGPQTWSTSWTAPVT